MRALGLCLFGALCLHVLGCANPSQPPSFDPFLGKTTVPPPGTGLAAPQSYYPEAGAPAAVPPQSRLPGRRTSGLTTEQDAADLEEASSGGWRPNSSGRVRLASGTVDDQPAGSEATNGEPDDVRQAAYDEEFAESEAAIRTNPIRRRPTSTARSTDTEGTADFE